MCVYLRIKLQVSSIILTIIRQGGGTLEHHALAASHIYLHKSSHHLVMRMHDFEEVTKLNENM